MENLAEVFVAAGGTLSEDDTQVKIPPSMLPFEIVLMVVPTHIDMDEYGAEVTFLVMIEDDRMGIGNIFHAKEYDVSVKLPLKAIELLKDRGPIY